MADKSQWDSATFKQRENLLRRANMPFEDYLKEAAGQEWQDTDGTKVKFGQHPHHDVQHLCDQWCASVEHCMNDLGMDLPDTVKDSYTNLQATRRKQGLRPYAETLVKHYADHIGGRIREMAGMKGKSAARPDETPIEKSGTSAGVAESWRSGKRKRGMRNYPTGLSVISQHDTTHYIPQKNPHEAYMNHLKQLSPRLKEFPNNGSVDSGQAYFMHEVGQHSSGATTYSVATIGKRSGLSRYTNKFVYVDQPTYGKIHEQYEQQAAAKGQKLGEHGSHHFWMRA